MTGNIRIDKASRRAGAPIAMMTRMMAITANRMGAWSFMEFHLNIDGASNTSNGSTQS